MPHASFKQLTQQDPGCEESQVSNGFAELVHHVNLIWQQGMTKWVDPRGLLSQKAAELGLSADEVTRIRKTIGYVICPGQKNEQTIVSTAMVVGNGTQIVTDAHAFMDSVTGRRHEPLEDCMFINQYDYTAIKLDFSSEDRYKFYTTKPNAEWYKDLAIVKLKKRVPGRTFSFDLENKPLNPGDKLIMVSADQLELPFRVPQVHIPRGNQLIPVLGGQFNFATDINNEPIAQACHVMKYFPQGSGAIYSDCSATKGASGSVVFVRGSDGELHARALDEQGGFPSADLTPFKVGPDVPDKDLSYSLAVGLDANVNSDIAELQNNVHLANER